MHLNFTMQYAIYTNNSTVPTLTHRVDLPILYHNISCYRKLPTFRIILKISYFDLAASIVIFAQETYPSQIPLLWPHISLAGHGCAVEFRTGAALNATGAGYCLYWPYIYTQRLSARWRTACGSLLYSTNLSNSVSTSSRRLQKFDHMLSTLDKLIDNRYDIKMMMQRLNQIYVTVAGYSNIFKFVLTGIYASIRTHQNTSEYTYSRYTATCTRTTIQLFKCHSNWAGARDGIPNNITSIS